MDRRNLLSLAMLAAPVALLAGMPAADAAVPKKNRGLFINNVRGSVVFSVVQPNGTFRGSALIKSLSFSEGVLSVTGVLNGKVRNAAGKTARHIVNQAFTTTATLTGSTGAVSAKEAAAACPILNLDIGAINLDLLGLVIDLSPISLDIIAQSGPGKLLGNLLCALVGLLNPLGLLEQILAIIEQINDLLDSRRIIGGGA